jgi:hypothetical protein
MFILTSAAVVPGEAAETQSRFLWNVGEEGVEEVVQLEDPETHQMGLDFRPRIPGLSPGRKHVATGTSLISRNILTPPLSFHPNNS